MRNVFLGLGSIVGVSLKHTILYVYCVDLLMRSPTKLVFHFMILL